MTQQPIKLIILGGFLGAGKTTLIIELGKKFVSELDKTVAIVTNDQGEVLVDTKTVKDFGFACAEVLHGCYCCKFPEFVTSLHEILAKIKPDVIFAEPVGSCTDLLATVYAPLRQYYQDEVSLCPYIVLVDASTILEYDKRFNITSPKAPLGFLISWQLQEADIIGINKVDLISTQQLTEVKNLVMKINEKAEVIPLSSKTGYNIDRLVEIVAEKEHSPRSCIEVNYDTYGAAEAELGWFNGSWKVVSERPINPNEFVKDLMIETASRIEGKNGQIAHLKLNFSTKEGSAKASLVTLERGVDFTHELPIPSRTMDVIMNIRVKLDPKSVEECVREALKSVTSKYGAEHSDWFAKSFRPAFPRPYYRLPHTYYRLPHAIIIK